MAKTEELELSWAAGFFDGEGTFGVNTDSKDGAKRIQISVKQTDVRPLLRFKEAVGVGNISGPYQGNKLYHQKQYRWSAYSENAYSFINKIKPYISEPKLEQLNKSLKIIEEYKLKKGE